MKEFRINGTDVAAICGLSRYCTPYELWAYKTGNAERQPIDEHLREKGVFLEPAIIKWFEYKTRKSVDTSQNDILFRHPKYEFMTGKVDGIIKGENALIEAKTAYRGDEWGSHGDNIIPDEYLCQIAHYAMIKNVECVYVAVLIMGADFRCWYKYTRDADIENEILSRELEFRHAVLNDSPPPYTTSKDILLAMQSYNAAGKKVATMDVFEEVQRLAIVKEERKEKEKEEKELIQKLQLFMVENDTLLSPAGKIIATWKTSKPRMSFDRDSFEKEHPDLFKKYYKKGKPSRTFLVKKLGENYE